MPDTFQPPWAGGCLLVRSPESKAPALDIVLACDASIGPTHIVHVVPVEKPDLANEMRSSAAGDFAQTSSDDARWRHEISFLGRCHQIVHKCGFLLIRPISTLAHLHVLLLSFSLFSIGTSNG